MVAVRDLAEVLNADELSRVVKTAAGPGWVADKGAVVRPASTGISGFLGDHFRTTLQLTNSEGQQRPLHLFIKRLPLNNKQKADFILLENYSRREMLMYRLLEEFGGDEGPNQWRPRAYLCDEQVLVMPDLAVEGYAPQPVLATLELPQVLLAAASTARFHAAFADYNTRHPCDFLAEHENILKDPTFCESPWLRAAAKLSANFLAAFSTRPKDLHPDLESRLYASYLAACDSLREYSDTLNVVIHKDLWINNILFAPNRAVIVDFQCVRFGPPAFDPLILLYLTTTREFRDRHEREVLLHYYSVFREAVSPATRLRLKELGYDREELLRWCERARLFGSFYAIGIFPYVLMEAEEARRHFDDPETFLEYCNVDRSRPVLDHARVCPQYRSRQLDALHEYVDRYLHDL